MTKPEYRELVPPALRGKLDFLAQVYCPLKKGFAEAYTRFENDYNAAHTNKLTGLVPAVTWSKDPYYTIDDLRSPEHYPWTVTDTGFGEFFQGEFLQNKEKLSWFTTPPPYNGPVHPLYENIRLADPRGIFGIFGGFPYVFIINHEQLKGRKVPRSVFDLTKPEYAGSVAAGYGADDISEVLLMEIEKEQGAPGLRALAVNIGFTGGFVAMRNAAEAGRKNIAIYFMYHAFAEEVKKAPPLELVFPEKTLFAPLYALCKQGGTSDPGAEKQTALADFLYSAETGAVMNNAGFTHINAAVKHNLPAACRLHWASWDYIHAKPLPLRVKELESVFNAERRRLGLTWPA